jgi:hypothetical protein
MTITRCPAKTIIPMTILLVILSLFVIPSSQLHSADSMNVPINGADQQTDVISTPSITVVERSLWVGEKKLLTPFDLKTGSEVLRLSVEHLEDIASDNARGVVWTGTKKEIIRYDFGGSVFSRHLLKQEKIRKDFTVSETGDDKGKDDDNNHHGNDHPRIRLSLDPSEGSLWYSAGREVIKLSSGGKELFRIEMPEQVTDISVDISDGSCWVGRDHFISRYSTDGILLLGFAVDSDDRVTALAADPLTQTLWIGGQKGLIKVDTIGQELFRTKEPRDIQDLEVNTATGMLWLADKKNVHKYVQNGQKLFTIPLCPREGNERPSGTGDDMTYQGQSGSNDNPENCSGNLVTLAVDSLDDTCWVASNKTLFQLDDNGTLLLQIQRFHHIEALDIGMPKLDIAITDPSEGAVFTTPSVTVRGKISDPGATVEVNGTRVEVKNLAFEAQNVVLTAGANRIMASAENIAHQNVKDSVQVIYEPPVIGPSLLVCPEPYFEQSAHEPVVGCPQQVPIGTKHWNRGYVLGLVDDTVKTLIVDGISIMPGYFYGKGRILYGEWRGSFFWGLLYLAGPDGSYPVAVTAMDAQGKTISATVTFIKDMVPPKITITSPADGTVTNKQTITVNGIIDDSSAAVTDDQTGRIIPVVNGAFTYEVNMGSMDGEQFIFVRATDGALNWDFDGVTIIRDTTPPQISTTLPAEGMYKNSQTIVLTGTIADQNPGTVSVTTNNGPPQFLTVSGTGYSGTASLINGSNDILFTATDKAGNTGTLNRTVIVDQGPPEAVITSPSPNSNLTGTTAVSITATDALSGIQSVTMLIDSKVTGTLTRPPYDFPIDTFTLTPGSHTLTARAADRAGNKTETSITITIPHQFGIQISAPLSDTTINKTAAIIQGTITPPAGREIGVRINGIPAEQLGTGFAAIVPLLQGQNTITATATNIYGIEEQAIITINTVTTQEQVRLMVNPASGIMTARVGGTMSFITSMNVETYPTDTVTSYAWDLNGDGSAEQSGELLTKVTATYQTPGLYFPTVTVTDTMGNVYTETAIVNVLDRNAMDALLRAKWEEMKGMLVGGDIENYLSYFIPPVRDKYRRIFSELGSGELNAIFTSNYELQLDTLFDREAECGALRLENGRNYSYPVMFIRDADGLWRIGVL